jgi:hypothetical protein
VSVGGESELGRFLRARRAAIRPQSVGLAEPGSASAARLAALAEMAGRRDGV